MQYDLHYYDDDERIAYRLNAKSIRVGEGALIDEARSDMVEKGVSGMQLLVQVNLPLLRFGTRKIEKAVDVDSFDDEKCVWKELSLDHIDEEFYNNSPEQFVASWISIIMAKNPQRTMGELEFLKKTIHQLENIAKFGELPNLKMKETNTNEKLESV